MNIISSGVNKAMAVHEKEVGGIDGITLPGTAPASCAEVVLVAARPLLASAVSPPFRGETATSSTAAAPENRQD